MAPRRSFAVQHQPCRPARSINARKAVIELEGVAITSSGVQSPSWAHSHFLWTPINTWP
jgi:hypothetical protein